MTTKNSYFEQGAVLLGDYGTAATWRKPVGGTRFAPAVIVMQCGTADEGVYTPAADVTVHGVEALQALREAIRMALGEPELVTLPCAPDAALQWRAAGFDRLVAQHKALRARLASLEAAYEAANERNRELWNAVNSQGVRDRVLGGIRNPVATAGAMHPSVSDALEGVDAAMFSGDTFNRHDARMLLRDYLKRWNEWDTSHFYYAPDGTMLNADGTRSIFDDVDQ